MQTTSDSRGPQPNDLPGRIREIKDCVARADMDLAVKRLIDLIRDFCQEMEDEVILISMDFHVLSKKERMEVLGHETAALDRRKIASRILQTLYEAKRQIYVN